MTVICLYKEYIGGWGGESAAAPTGKSFRFVRACERAGARAARDQLLLPRGFCETNVFVSPAVVFLFFCFETKGLKKLTIKTA